MKNMKVNINLSQLQKTTPAVFHPHIATGNFRWP